MTNILIDFHCHTSASHDGLMDPPSLYRAARAVGLDAVAVTDHDTIEGALAVKNWLKANQIADFEIITGEERTLADGSHVIGLFLESPLQATELPQLAAEIQSQDGLVLIPHPYRNKDGLFRPITTGVRSTGFQPVTKKSPASSRSDMGHRQDAGATFSPDRSRYEMFHRLEACCFELFNAKCDAATNAAASDLLETGMFPFGGSDAHYDCDLGECVCEITRAGDLETSVRRALAGETPMRILGTPRDPSQGERVYAPLYYRIRPFFRIPRPLVPAARQIYRHFRNKRQGIGRKPLEIIWERR